MIRSLLGIPSGEYNKVMWDIIKEVVKYGTNKNFNLLEILYLVYDHGHTVEAAVHRYFEPANRGRYGWSNLMEGFEAEWKDEVSLHSCAPFSWMVCIKGVEILHYVASNRDSKIKGYYIKENDEFRWVNGAYLMKYLPRTTGRYIRTLKHSFSMTDLCFIPIPNSLVPEGLEWEATNVKDIYISNEVGDAPFISSSCLTAASISEASCLMEDRVGMDKKIHPRALRVVAQVKKIPFYLRMLIWAHAKDWADLDYGIAKVMFNNKFREDEMQPGMMKMLSRYSTHYRYYQHEHLDEMTPKQILFGAMSSRLKPDVVDLNLPSMKVIMEIKNKVAKYSKYLISRVIYLNLLADHNLRNLILKEANSFDVRVLSAMMFEDQFVFLANCYMRDKKGFKEVWRNAYPAKANATGKVRVYYMKMDLRDFWGDLRDMLNAEGAPRQFCTMSNLMRRSIAWHAQVNTRMSNDSSPFPPSPLQDTEGITYLSNKMELSLEGRAMHHCVAGYDIYCAMGQSFIYSIKYKGERATLELTRNCNIKQLRGVCNYSPSPELWAFVNKWLDEERSAKKVLGGNERAALELDEHIQWGLNNPYDEDEIDIW